MYKKINFKKKSFKFVFVIVIAFFILCFAFQTFSSKLSNYDLVNKNDQIVTNADIEIQLAKDKLQNQLNNSKKFKSEILKNTEYSILTVNDSYSKTYDENPDCNFFTSWATKKKVTLFINYSSKYMLPTDCLICYIEDSGVVSFVFNRDNVYVHTKLLKTSERTEKGLLKPNFSNAEILALQSISSDCIDNSLINNTKNYNKAVKTFTSYLVNKANVYSIKEIRVNGELINVDNYLRNNQIK